MNIPSLYKGEAKIRRVSYSSTQGASVTLELPDMEAMNAYLGHEGKRIAIMAVLVGDDEQPVPPQRKASEPRKRSARAFLMTQSRDFQAYVGDVSDFGATADGADKYIKYLCGIDSKSELDTYEEAAAQFEAICNDFNLWMESHR